MHEKVNGLGAALDPADGPLLSAPDAADVVDADVPSDVPSDAADDAPAADAASAALPPPPAPPLTKPPSAVEVITLEIVIPLGHVPGSKLTCRGPDGAAYTMTVPGGAVVGSKVQFKVPKWSGPPAAAAAGGAGAEAMMATLRMQGNVLFKEARFGEAVRRYSEAIRLDPAGRAAEAHVLHSNLSAAHAALSAWPAALHHAQVCLTLQPNFAKGYSRYGTALAHQGRLGEAISAFERCLALDPSNAVAREAMTQAQQALERHGGAGPAAYWGGVAPPHADDAKAAANLQAAWERASQAKADKERAMAARAEAAMAAAREKAAAREAKILEQQAAARLLAESRQTHTDRMQLALRRGLRVAPEARGGGEGAPSSAEPKGERPPRPEPRGRLLLAEPELAGALMGVWAMAASFADDLETRKFAPHELAAALQRKGASPLLAQLQLRLLRELLSNVAHLREQQQVAFPPLEKALLLQQLPAAESINVSNWTEVLRSVCWLLPELHENAAQRAALHALQQASDYDAVQPKHKLELLRSLVDTVVISEGMCDRLRENETKQNEMTRDFNTQWREVEATYRVADARDDAKAREAEAALGFVHNPHHNTALPAPDQIPSAAEALAAARAAGAPAAAAAAGADADGDANMGDDAAAEGAAAAPAAAPSPTLVGAAAGPMPSQANALALVAAIAERNTDSISAAMEVATQEGGGAHCGVDRTTGRRWVTTELQLAHRVHTEEERARAKRARRDELATELAERTRHLDASLSKVALREEPLGTDDLGRNYWAFAHDASRLWVELPRQPELVAPIEGVVAQVEVPAGLAPGQRFQGTVEGGAGGGTTRFEVVLPIGVSGGETISVRLPAPPPPPPPPPPHIPTPRGVRASAESNGADSSDGADAEDAALAQWRWAFFSDAAEVEQLATALSGASARESKLRKALRARLKGEWATAMPPSSGAGAEAAGWKPSGHDLVGRRVLRRPRQEGDADGDAAMGDDDDDDDDDDNPRRVAWLSGWKEADEVADGGGGGGGVARFVAVYDDGTEEVLSEAEAEAAVEASRKVAVAAHGCCGLSRLPQPKHEAPSNAPRDATTWRAAAAGLEGARAQLLELEASMLPALRQIDGGWDNSTKSKGPKAEDGVSTARKAWRSSVRTAATPAALAASLLKLEEYIKTLQSGADVSERRPWRTEGDELIGQRARRFYDDDDGVPQSFDGKIKGFLPSDLKGEADETLWRLVYDGGDEEEELYQVEAHEAIRDYAEGRTVPSAEAVARAAADKAKAEAEANGEEEEEEQGGSVNRARRLWASRECRERWATCLSAPHSAAVVALAVTSLREMASLFLPVASTVGEGARLTNRKTATRAELTFAQEAWHHVQAFEEKKEPKKPVAAKQPSVKELKAAAGKSKSNHLWP